MYLHVLALPRLISRAEQRSPSGKQIAPRSQRLRGLCSDFSFMPSNGLSPVHPRLPGLVSCSPGFLKQVQSTILRSGIKNSLVMDIRKCKSPQNYRLANRPILNGTGPASATFVPESRSQGEAVGLAFPFPLKHAVGGPGGVHASEEVDTLFSEPVRPARCVQTEPACRLKRLALGINELARYQHRCADSIRKTWVDYFFQLKLSQGCPEMTVWRSQIANFSPLGLGANLCRYPTFSHGSAGLRLPCLFRLRREVRFT